jgi:hypothetical protein
VRRIGALALGALALALAAGCGGGSRAAGNGATLRITRNFGHELVSSFHTSHVPANEDVGRTVSGRIKGPSDVGGRYWLNGLLPAVTVDDEDFSPGDFVQWDYSPRDATKHSRAIVGAYPQPFVGGVGGKRFPVRVECEDTGDAACRAVKDTLGAEGVHPSGAALGAPGNQKVLRVVVARWKRARELPTVRAIEQGPAHSGVFARFTQGGRALDLLDRSGRVASRAPAGTGLVAALRPSDTELIWVVTGLDDAGVERAAHALNASDLRDAFAVAATPGRVEKLPSK